MKDLIRKTAIKRIHALLAFMVLIVPSLACFAEDGDIVFDKVTGTDINCVINHILGKNALSSSQNTLYDLDENGVVNGIDLNRLIDLALGKGIDIRDGVFKINGVLFKMIKVEGGIMDYGELGQRQINDFWIMETEVTQQQAYAIRQKYNINNEPDIYVYWSYPSMDFVDNEGNICTNEHFPTIPCFFKTLDIISQYVEAFSKIGLRLPTVEEWEYAARGGTLSNGYKYSGSDDIDEVAWYKDNCNDVVDLRNTSSYTVGFYYYFKDNGIPNTVKTKKPNELGLYDMSGNAAEVTIVKNSQYPCDNGHYMIQGGSAHSPASDCVIGASCEPVQYFADIYKNPGYEVFQPCYSVGLRMVMDAKPKSGTPSLIEFTNTTDIQP